MNTPVIASAQNPAVIAEEPVRTRCPNCLEPLLGAFCYACGQPRKGFIRHLAGILEDFLDTVFNIDSRTIRTLLPLYLKPGFLSLEYFAGRQVRYVTPLRLYFFFSVLAFLAVSWVAHVDGGAIVIDDDVPSAMQDPQSLRAQRDRAVAELDKQRAEMGEIAFKATQTAVRQAFDAQIAAAESRAKEAAAKVSGRPADGPKRDATPVAPAAVSSTPVTITTGEDPDSAPSTEKSGPKLVFFNSEPWDPTTDPVQISWLSDGANLWLTNQVERMVKNSKLVKDDPDRFLGQVFSLAPQTLFVMLPLFALMLKCFFLFKRRLYMEHLIVALHSHSFLCLSILLLAALFALGEWCGAGSWGYRLIDFIEVLVIGWIPIYLFLAQKRIYRQGWIMTSIKYMLIGTAYTTLISFGIMINMMLSLAWL